MQTASEFIIENDTDMNLRVTKLKALTCERTTMNEQQQNHRLRTDSSLGYWGLEYICHMTSRLGVK